MSTKKTIQINPELFKLSGNKTRKNREKKELTLNPVVSPNNLKNKLLNRIKEHKKQEIKEKIAPPTSGVSTQNGDTDEFYGALNYLSELTKKQKVNEAKHRALNTKTLKNYQSSYQSSPNTAISLELPPELQETKQLIPQTNDVFNINYKIVDDVPYGCLKNGKKNTYREWKELSKKSMLDIHDIVRPPTPPKKNVGMFLKGATPVESQKSIETSNKLYREERLEQIKNKLKKIQEQETQIQQQTIDDLKKEKEYSTPLTISHLDDLKDFDNNEFNNSSNSRGGLNIEEMLKEREKEKEKDKTKKYLKKTVKRKFALGKSDKLRIVSVLIKNRQTRKNIVNTQKELKKTNITDIKKYLRQHGIIKVGSTCPTDILRKTFESAMLTGEVTNTNKETLLHNFLSGEH